MGTHYDLAPELLSKFQSRLSYTSCDEMTKTSQEQVGLKLFSHLLSISISLLFISSKTADNEGGDICILKLF